MLNYQDITKEVILLSDEIHDIIIEYRLKCKEYDTLLKSLNLNPFQVSWTIDAYENYGSEEII